MRLFPGLFLLLLALAAVGATSPSDPARWPGPNPAAGVMGLHWFEPNMGQADGDVRFLSRGDGIRVGVSADCLHLVSRTPGGADQVRLRLLGANSSAQVRGEHPLRGHANCLLGNDPARWRRRVPLYRQVRAESVYPGIDLVCYRGGAGLEYDFQVAPGADPGQIRLACEGAARVETAGQELVFHTRYGAFRQ